MAFKKIPPTQAVADSPENLLRDLPRRKIPGLLVHQGEMLKAYARDCLTERDVALQLPTGSGKTLVGLLLAEWRRRKYGERVVYLCPTKQLVNQVVEQADEKYGLSVIGMTGRQAEYAPESKAWYQKGDRVAITTYSGLFNTNPYFSNADVLILDDAHAAENYIATMWSLRIDRFNPEHMALHAAVASVLKPFIPAQSYTRLAGNWESLVDKLWVDKLPTPIFFKIQDEIRAVLDEHVSNLGLRYQWRLLSDSLLGCHLYLGASEILIRPLIPPTWTHDAFERPKQRVYMSATLGSGGDLERLTGRKTIRRLPIPEGWDRQGIGRRFFIFPNMSLGDDEAKDLQLDLMDAAGRSVVLVPSDAAKDEMVKTIADELEYPVFSATDLEETKKAFVALDEAVAVVANRYDGIDFPGNDCRLLFVDGLPQATNLQERFLMERMGCSVLFNERVQTRVLQAIGRCTRGLEDYSAVVVSGEELSSYLVDPKRRAFLHPELQAELTFGIEQSQGTTSEAILENLEIFLANSKDWEAANAEIIALRSKAVQSRFPAIADLERTVSLEVEYQNGVWQGDYDAALEAAKKVLGYLTAPELRGYRAAWHYLAGAAAWLGAENGRAGLLTHARAHFRAAKEASRGVPWLVQLSQYQPENEQVAVQNEGVMRQVEQIELVLANFGTLHDRKFERVEREILEGLQDAKRFEASQKQLGELLGFSTGKVESDASPDPWWISGDVCIVFEDNAGATDAAVIDATKARQAASHPQWMKEHVREVGSAEIVPVLVTPATQAKSGAMPHLKTVALWALADYRTWAKKALQVIRKMRGSFSSIGDLVWRSEAAELLEGAELDAHAIVRRLKAKLAADNLKIVP